MKQMIEAFDQCIASVAQNPERGLDIAVLENEVH